MREVVIVGVGIHPFGRFADKSYIDMGREAVLAALRDANMEWRDVQSAFCASMYLPATSGLRILSQLGRTGIPIADVEAACASGGIALRQAYIGVASGFCDVALAFGVEKMPGGFMEPSMIYEDWQVRMGLAMNPMYWAIEARRHMHEYGTTRTQLAKISVKSHRNASYCPFAMYRRPLTVEEVLSSRLVCDPINLFMICSPNEGAAAVLVCTEELARRYGSRPVTMAASMHKTAKYPNFQAPVYSISANNLNPPVSVLAASAAYEMAGLGPEDLDLVELQDGDAFSEVKYSEQLSLCQEGEGGRLIDEGVSEIGGSLPINTSGGLISCGEPVGASHLRQIYEIVTQLRGEARQRQVQDAKVGLAHVRGAGGNSAVTILKR